MKKSHIFLFLTLFISGSAAGIGVGEVTSIMFANDQMLAKEIDNASDTARFVSVSAHRISTPMSGGKIIPMEQNGELLSTPANMILPAGAREHFRFIYHGPQDDKERYYRVQFTEMPITLFPGRNRGKKSEAIPAIALETILVVRPRKMNLHYMLDEQKGVLENTGNTFFKIIVQKGCNSTDDEATIRYILPGETYRSPELKAQNKKFIVALQKYIPVGSGCFTHAS